MTAKEPARKRWHNARRGPYEHPTPTVECAYCTCGEAIVRVTGIWWHLRHRAPEPTTRPMGRPK